MCLNSNKKYHDRTIGLTNRDIHDRERRGHRWRTNLEKTADKYEAFCSIQKGEPGIWYVHVLLPHANGAVEEEWYDQQEAVSIAQMHLGHNWIVKGQPLFSFVGPQSLQRIACLLADPFLLKAIWTILTTMVLPIAVYGHSQSPPKKGISLVYLEEVTRIAHQKMSWTVKCPSNQLSSSTAPM